MCNYKELRRNLSTAFNIIALVDNWQRWQRWFNLNKLAIYAWWLTILRLSLHLGCVPFGESKNGFLTLDLPDFSVERNVKSEIGFVTLVTFRQRVQYARQPLKKWRVNSFLLFDKFCDYTVPNLVVGSSNSEGGTYITDEERSALELKII